LPLAPDAKRVNVAAQAEDPDSLLSLTRRLIAVRRTHPALSSGDFVPVAPTSEGTYAFRREAPGAGVTVAINLTDTPATIPGVDGVIRIGTDRSRDGERVAGALDLAPNEALVVEDDQDQRDDVGYRTPPTA
jgi:alpha-glucosidase